MFYLVTGSRCILLLNEMEAAHVGCTTQEVELKRHILELEKDVCGFDQKYALLSSEKAVAEEVQSMLEMKVGSLTQANKGLMIQNECLEQDVSDRDKLLGEA